MEIYEMASKCYYSTEIASGQSRKQSQKMGWQYECKITK